MSPICHESCLLYELDANLAGTSDCAVTIMSLPAPPHFPPAPPAPALPVERIVIPPAI